MTEVVACSGRYEPHYAEIKDNLQQKEFCLATVVMQMVKDEGSLWVLPFGVLKGSSFFFSADIASASNLKRVWNGYKIT